MRIIPLYNRITFPYRNSKSETHLCFFLHFLEVKVKLSLFLSKQHTLKTYGRMEV